MEKRNGSVLDEPGRSVFFFDLDSEHNYSPLGVSFGEGQMDRRNLDAEMDNWVKMIVNEDTFPVYLKDYIRREEMWEDAQSGEDISCS